MSSTPVSSKSDTLSTPLPIKKRVQRKRLYSATNLDDNAQDGYGVLRLDFDEDKEKKQPETKQENTTICQLDIGREVYVVAQTFQGRTYVHVRRYGKRLDGGIFPTKTGISLDLEKWKKIHELQSDNIDESIRDYQEGKTIHYKSHLGDNYFVTLNTGYPLINIRKWFVPEGQKELVPTRKGIALTFEQWDKLKDSTIVVREFIGEELDRVTYCEFSDSHQNQMGFYECRSCCPNGYLSD